MSYVEKNTNNNLYYSIIQGSLRLAVPEGTVDAIPRDWEAGGKKGRKWEIEYKAIVGKICRIDFYKGESDGKKFMNLNIILDGENTEKTPVISVPVKTRYASDIMKKLPNIDYAEEVRIRPYSFQPEGEDKRVIGVEITQRDGTGQFNKKITSPFFKKEGEKWIATNGFPVPDEETRESGEWEDYYRAVTKFLVNYTQTQVIPSFQENKPMPKSYEEEHENDISPEDDIKPENIPW